MSRRWQHIVLVWAAVVFVTVVAATEVAGVEPATRPEVVVLALSGVIGPASSDFVVRGIKQAERTSAELIVLRIDTPGGLDTAMRDIVQKILTTNVPVVGYVAPAGSRAASAGTYILYATHIAAMAKASNLGAATPVQLTPGGVPRIPRPSQRDSDGDDSDSASDGAPETDSDAKKRVPTNAMERKIVNDAVAYIRGLALLRKRNAQWAERAVREGASMTAEDALEHNVIDLIALDLQALLRQINGRVVDLPSESRVLTTTDADIRVLEPDWLNRMLSIITNPNIAYVLMLLGVYGLFFELSNPGGILPGVAGAVCLVLALYALHILPVNYAGLALMLLGVGFMVGEAFAPSFGALGIGGAIAFVTGSLLLIDTDVADFRLSIPLVLGFAAVSTVFFLSIVAMTIRQRHRPVVSGAEELLGMEGEAAGEFTDGGTVLVHGEMWQASSRVPIASGQRIRVVGREGLRLNVEPLIEEQSK